jgi:hypothetical protein
MKRFTDIMILAATAFLAICGWGMAVSQTLTAYHTGTICAKMVFLLLFYVIAALASVPVVVVWKEIRG